MCAFWTWDRFYHKADHFYHWVCFCRYPSFHTPSPMVENQILTEVLSYHYINQQTNHFLPSMYHVNRNNCCKITSLLENTVITENSLSCRMLCKTTALVTRTHPLVAWKQSHRAFATISGKILAGILFIFRRHLTKLVQLFLFLKDYFNVMTLHCEIGISKGGNSFNHDKFIMSLYLLLTPVSLHWVSIWFGVGYIYIYVLWKKTCLQRM